MKILEDIISTLKEDAPVKKVRIGSSWTAVWSRHCGLASTLTERDHSAGPPVRDAGHLEEKSALELCAYALSGSLLERSVGLAAINSLVEVDFLRCQQINAAEVLYKKGRGKRVCVVGHFPFIPNLKKEAAELWVLERRPQIGDLPAEEAARIIPQADVLAFTGTALINGTMDELLALCRKDALIMILGPTTPLSPVWFKYGIDLVSGTMVTEPETVLKLVSQGIIFSQFRGRGVKLMTMAENSTL
ncbi:MAG: DUF364 domain-containing protein [Firmicutes bacterium]|nr:DUF364 domain-containing protein [Bacillota bacterium]